MATSSPSIVTRPLVGSTSRLTIFMVVVLPQPDGPTRTHTSPAPTSSERSVTAGGPSPYRLVTCSKATTDPLVAGAVPGDGSVMAPMIGGRS